MQVVVDGLITNYVKAGSGSKVLVCLHGWGDSAQSFAQLSQKLAKKYTVLVPDLPSFGNSQETPRPWGVDDYARFVSDWLSKIGQKRIDVVIGHSNGGAIAIALLGHKLVSPKKLILLSASGIRDIYKLRRLVLGSGAKLAKMPLKLLPKTAQNKIKRRAYEAIGSDYMLLPELDATFRKLVSQDMQATATHIKQPTLIIYGSEDDATPVKYGQLYKEAIPSSELKIMGGAGHFIHQERADEVAKAVGAFVGA